MVKNSTYFYLSGLLSLSFFLFFLSLFIYMMFVSSKAQTFALKKDNYISISIEMPIIETQKDKKSIKKMDNIVSDVASIQEPIQAKDVNVEDLFSDVWTKKITKSKSQKKEKRVEKKLVNAKVLKELEKKIKTLEKSDKKQISKEFETVEKTSKDKDENKVSTANEVNEYLAKINALVYKYFYPPSNSQGHSVKTVIELSAIGKVEDFRILSYSANDALNKECEKIKVRLMSVIFPLNPKNKSSRTIVILTSEE